MAMDGPPLDELLARARQGSEEAAAHVFEQLYDELRAIAARVAGRDGRGTLSPTAVVHETWLKLARAERAPRVEDRAHFLNLAARAMRQVVANHVRDRQAAKRGGGRERERLTLALDDLGQGGGGVELVDLHDALASLEALDARQADVAVMRVFGGLGSREIGTLLGVSARTIELDWRMAKAHLARALELPQGERP